MSMRKLWTNGVAILALAATAAVSGGSGRLDDPRRERRSFVSIDIGSLSEDRLAALKQAADVIWWVELEDRLLAALEPGGLRRLSRGLKVAPLPGPIRPDRLAFAGLPLSPELAGCRVVARGGRWAVVALDRARAEAAPRHEQHPDFLLDGSQVRHCAGPVLPFRPNTVLTRQWRGDPPDAGKRQATVEALLAEVDSVRWFADMFELSCFNRYTRGTEIAEARDWLANQFLSVPGWTVTTESFQVGSDVADNVIAVMTGSVRPDDWHIVGAHYDSIASELASDPEAPSPGAEDNGSGVAALLEMARAFSRHPPESTLIFIAYSGEEQGLFGSLDHAQKLIASGDDAKVKSVLVMDMIGYTRDPVLDCLLETDETGQGLVDVLAAAAKQYTELSILTSTNPFGSDHVSYLSNGIPAVLVIENDWNRYPNYHRSSDVTDLVGLEMGREVIKMNLAALAQLAGLEGAATPTESP